MSSVFSLGVVLRDVGVIQMSVTGITGFTHNKELIELDCTFVA